MSVKQLFKWTLFNVRRCSGRITGFCSVAESRTKEVF